MARFKLPNISPYIRSLKENMVKIMSKISRKRLITGVLLLTLLATNSIFWIYRASKSQGELGDEADKLLEWELDLNEDYLDAQIAQDIKTKDVLEEVEEEPKEGRDEGHEEGLEEVEANRDLVEEETREIAIEPQGQKETSSKELAETPQEEVVKAQPVMTTQKLPALATMTLPTLGRVITQHSTDQLVYSKTLEQWCVHSGIDIEAAAGTAVKAAMEGVVEEVRKNDPRLGIVVVLDHGGNIKTLYGNLASDNLVKKGDTVKKGQVIGAVGQSAPYEIEDPPHLHFELLKDGKPIDPQQYLPKLN